MFNKSEKEVNRIEWGTIDNNSTILFLSMFYRNWFLMDFNEPLHKGDIHDEF